MPSWVLFFFFFFFYNFFFSFFFFFREAKEQFWQKHQSPITKPIGTSHCFLSLRKDNFLLKFISMADFV